MGDLSCGFSTIAFQALSENAARRAVGRKADLCPARAGRGLPAACRAEWAAVVEWNGAGLRAITAKQEDDNEAEAVASEARRPRRRDVEPHWRGSNFRREADFVLRGGVVGRFVRGGRD